MTPIVMLSGRARSGKGIAAEVIAKELGGVIVSLADPIKRFLSDPEGFGLTVEQLWGSQKEDAFMREQPSVGVLTQLAEAHFGIADPDMVDVFQGALERWEGTLPKRTTARHMMQTLGTDCVRKDIDDDFLIDYGLEISEQLLRVGGGYDREQGVLEDEKYPNVVVIDDGRFRNEVLPVLEMGGVVLKTERPAAGVVLTASAAAHASETQQNTIPPWWFTGKLMNDGTLEHFQESVRRWCHTVAVSLPLS